MRIDLLRKSIIVLACCGPVDVGRADEGDRRDVHSYSRPDLVRVTQLGLSLRVDFEEKILHGNASWQIERQPVLGPRPCPLVRIPVDGPQLMCLLENGPVEKIGIGLVQKSRRARSSAT